MKNKKINLNLFFHFYKHHKDELTSLRLWCIARYILDKNGRGCVNLDPLCDLSGVNKQYFSKKCLNSKLFKLAGVYVYYLSSRKIITKHRLHCFKIRTEKMTQSFIKQFKDKKHFIGYITKCYFETDIRKKYKKLTVGRISIRQAAKYFEVSENTIRTNLKKSNAKKFDNILHFPNIRFKGKKHFSNWLLKNMDKSIQGHKISKNPKSFFIKRSDSDYYLCKRCPFIFKFTGVNFYRPKRGNMI